MTKRNDYSGGFISATSVPRNRGGIYSLSRHLQLEQTNSWNTDSNFNSVSLLLNADSSSTTTAFTKDNSANNFTIVPNGDTKPSNLNPFNQNYYSNYFNGSTDFLSLAGNAVFSITTSTTPFTIEAWVMPMGNTGCIFSEQWTGSANISIVISMADGVSMDTGTVGLTVCFGWYNGSAWTTAAGANQPLALGVWTHVACVFTGSTTRIYYNGYDVTKPSNPTPSTTWGITGVNGDSWYIGRRWDTSGSPYFNGFIKDFRFVKGTAVYTGNFTPPTSPLTAIANTSLLACQTGQFADRSGNSLTITTNGSTQVSQLTPFTSYSSQYPGSVYFDGTGDYLSIASGILVGTNNFTVEAWVYITSYTNVWQSIISTRASSSTAGATDVWVLGVNNTGYAYIYSGAMQIQGAAGQVPLAAWTHICVTRSGSTMTLYINGTSVQTATSSQNYSVSSASIGANKDGSEVWTGYINNLRLVVGSVVYTGNFTPPTAPLTAITNTVLLTCQNTGPVSNSAFIDRGTYNLTVVRNGNSTQGSFNPYGTGWSVLFNGSDNLSLASNPAFGFGTGNYTIECWIYATANPANGTGTICDLRTGATASATVVRINSSLQLMHYNGPANVETAFTSRTITLNTWTHIAVVRVGGTVSGYVNGVLAGSVASSNDFGSIQPLLIGQNQTAGYNFNGYISNFHIVKGTALYTANFTPSTSSITSVSGTSLLTCRSNRYLDESSNNFTITATTTASVQKFSPFANQNRAYSSSVYSGSVFFDGASDYLSVASTPATAFTTNNFTIEFWVYFTNSTGTGSHQGLYGNYNTWAAGSIYFGKHTSNSGYVAVYVNNFNNASAMMVETSFPPNNAWTHYALVRNGTAVTLYRNGVASATATVSATLSFTGGSNPVFIGAIGDILSTSSLPGYMSDFRISNYAVYLSSFTPPTTPLQSDSRTLLMISNQPAIVDQSMSFNVETIGDAKVSTAVSKFGGTSMYFDGTGDYILTSSTITNPAAAFSTGDFTIEFWFYALSNASTMQLFDTRPSGTATTSQYVAITYLSGSLNYYTAGLNPAISGGVVSANAWHHVAVTRSGTSTRLFVDGAQVGSTYTDSQNYLGGINRPIIGCDGNSVGTSLFNGYIDDLRITKGRARYTAAFTPPGKLAIQ